MKLQGTFRDQMLSSIFQFMYNDQKTGILTVNTDLMEDTSRVFFDQGTIIHASSPLKKERLGILLQNAGVITESQLSQCLEEAQENSLHVGKLLVKNGYVSEETLKEYIRQQLEATLYDLLLWEAGKFEYNDARMDMKNMIVTRLNPMKLILEASRQIDELSVLRKAIHSDTMVFKMSFKALPPKKDIKLNASDWHLFSLIDGTRSVHQIVLESGYDKFSVYKIINSLISLDIIEEKQTWKQKQTLNKKTGAKKGLLPFF